MQRIIQKYTVYWLVLLATYLGLLAGGLLHGVISAQSNDSDWNRPINLSLSGGATESQFVIDSEGVIHALWREGGEAFFYTTGSNTSFTRPERLDVPFVTRRYDPNLRDNQATPAHTPHLIADNTGIIHAFWIDTEQRLFYSFVPADEFTQFGAWSVRQLLAEAALNVGVAVSEANTLHLSYIRPVETASDTAGVYYRQFDNSIQAWRNAQRVDESGYFRTMTAGAANIQLALGSEGNIFLAWDVRAQDKVYFTRSNTDGITWQATRVIAERNADDLLGATGPQQVILQADADRVLLTWHAGTTTLACVQNLAISENAGLTFRPIDLPEDTNQCPPPERVNDARLNVQYGSLPVLLPDGVLLAQYYTDDARRTGQMVLWNGHNWSEVQPSSELTNFVNASTQRETDLGCQQIVLLDGDTLALLACDEAGGDIWLQTRSVPSMAAWSPDPTPTPIWRGSAENTLPLNTKPQSLTLLVSNHVQAFWTDGSADLRYAQHDGNRWAQPQAVKSVSDGRLASFDLHHSDNTLYAVWENGVTGQLWLSQVPATQTAIGSDWSPTVAIPVQYAAAEPSVTVDRSGTIWVAYAVPINEGRGIYVTAMSDGVWSEPELVFDAQAANWAVANSPHLASSADGLLHLLWFRLSRDGMPQSLHASIRGLSGTWGTPTTVTTNTPTWGTSIASDNGLLHRLWQETVNGQRIIRHTTSADNGATWDRPAQISGNTNGQPQLIQDGALRLHLLAKTASGIEHKIWADGAWKIEPRIDGTVSDSDLFAIGLASGGALKLVSVADDALVLNQRSIEYPSLLPTPLPTLTLVPTPLPTAAATVAPSIEPTLVFSTVPDSAETPTNLPIPIPNSLPSQLAFAAVPAALVVGLVFAAGLRRKSK